MAESTYRRLGPGADRPLETGDRAPGFTLRRTFDEQVALDELLGRGPVLLVFYVFDFGHV